MLIIGVSIILIGLVLHFVLYNYEKARVARVMISILFTKFIIGKLEDAEYEEKKKKVLNNLTWVQERIYNIVFKR